MKEVVAAFNQEKALVGAFSVITNLRMELFQALLEFHFIFPPDCIFIITKEVSLWVRKQFVTLMAADAGERRQELLHFIFKFMGIKTIIYGNTDTEDTVRR